MTTERHVILILSLIVLAIGRSQAAFYDDEQNLRSAVLSGYQYKIRPAATVTCNIRLSLLHVNILDVTGQRMSVSGWLTVIWNDTRLVWNSSDYGNIPDFYDTETVLWRPELIIDNEISNLDIIQNSYLLIRATSEGVMTWEPPGIFDTHCDVDITFYPFDTQRCIVEVTSWGYTLDEVDLIATDTLIYLEDYEESGEWEVLETWSVRQLLQDGTEYHSQLEFNMKLRRRPSYYVMTILVPVIVTSVLCILVFLLPAESGEKVGYILTVLLTYVVMLTLVAGYLPPTSKTTSILSVYLIIILFLGVFSTLATVISLFFHHHDEETPIPDWMLVVWKRVLIPVAAWRPADTPKDNDSDKVVDVYIPSPTQDKRSSKVHPEKISANNRNSNNSTTKYPMREKSFVAKRHVAKEGVPLGWQDLAVIMDAALFKLLGIFILVLTLGILICLIVGGYS